MSLIPTPLDKFLEPVLRAYVQGGVDVSFNRIEGNIVYLNVGQSAARCKSCANNALKSGLLRKIQRYYPNIVRVDLIPK